MYVSLEPCNHYGKTPPCTKSIIKSGISEVFYAIDDLDKKVKGKSSKILSKHNIKVKKGLLKMMQKIYIILIKLIEFINYPMLLVKLQFQKIILFIVRK